MWRVDWEEEAVQARKHSIAMQAERLLQGSPGDVTDVENSLNGAPQGSHLPGGGLAVDASAGHCLACVRAGQGGAGQGRQGRQGRDGRGRAGMGGAGQGWAGQGRDGRGRAGRSRTWPGKAGQGWAAMRCTVPGRAVQYNTAQRRIQHVKQSPLHALPGKTIPPCILLAL